MSEEPEVDPDLQRLEEAVRQTVATGHDLQSQVSELVFSALSAATARIDLARMREITQAALEGAGMGAQSHGARSAEVIRRSVDGVEDALLKAAGVTKLAIQEAAGHAAEFSKSDLSRAVDDLASLQALFLNVLGDVAKAGSQTAAVAFADIQRHIHDSGGALGETLADSAGELRKLFPPGKSEGPQAGMAAGKAAQEMGRMAGEFLAGIARGLEEPGKGSPRDADADKPEDS
jgi:hypothetical protein